MHKLIRSAAGAAMMMVLGAAVALAAPTPEQKCQQSKLKAHGKLLSCLATNEAGMIGGKDDASATCQSKFTTAIGKADTKAAAASASCRILDNGNGTLSDLNTGLMWEQKDGSGGGPNFTDPHDVDNQYQWSSSGTIPDGDTFTDFLAQLNGGTTSDGTTTTGCYAGRCDWRLPTTEELLALGIVGAAFQPDAGSYHWSASTDETVPANAWIVSTGGGLPNFDPKTTAYPVRAVRSGP
ncbi:MAG: DUF1566 domain-containing protein [Deltaproteobacteria bacterium]|nr:DUF1566 domain-containing protein [Deltaproteobacteria bacterium]